MDDVLIDMGDTSPSKRRKGRPDERFFRYAEQLREAVNRTDFRMQYNSLDWAREFEMLKVEQRELEEALTWFCANIKDPYALRIRSARAFRMRFSDVVEKMNRLKDRRPTDSPDELLHETRDILSELDTLIWPNGSHIQLSAVVQQSVINYKAFVERLTSPETVPGTYWIQRTILDEMTEVTHYLTQWFRGVWKRHHDWDAWSGDMGPFVWTPHQKDFINAVSREVRARSGMDVKWEQMLETPSKELKDGPHRRTS